MKKPDKIKVLGFEESAPERIRVVTECDGECYDKNFPQRISHNFDQIQKNFYEFEDGEQFFLKKMRKLYTSGEPSSHIEAEAISNKDEVELPDIEKHVEELNENYTGYEIVADGTLEVDTTRPEE